MMNKMMKKTHPPPPPPPHPVNNDRGQTHFAGRDP